MQSSISFPEMVTLGNSVHIPMIGFGTYTIKDVKVMTDVIKYAYDVGYRHIDTASSYKNERAIGKALKKNKIPREKIFITSKVWINEMGYDSALKAFEKSCKYLDTDYIDLYLIHWPTAKSMETWMALERLYAEGKVKAIGVSNFTIEDLNVIVESNHIKPMIDQIEMHPGYPQIELNAYCKRHLIAVSASAPLARGAVFEDPVCREIAASCKKSVSQIVLRWQYQLGIISLPKSVTKERIIQNIDIFDFSLDRSEMEALSSIDGVCLFQKPKR